MIMATPTDPRARVRTATPGGVADYHTDSHDFGALVQDLAAYGAHPDQATILSAWERDEWQRLADLALGSH